MYERVQCEIFLTTTPTSLTAVGAVSGQLIGRLHSIERQFKSSLFLLVGWVCVCVGPQCVCLGHLVEKGGGPDSSLSLLCLRHHLILFPSDYLFDD
jgi:hypothetical protein